MIRTAIEHEIITISHGGSHDGVVVAIGLRTTNEVLGKELSIIRTVAEFEQRLFAVLASLQTA